MQAIELQQDSANGRRPCRFPSHAALAPVPSTRFLQSSHALPRLLVNVPHLKLMVAVAVHPERPAPIAPVRQLGRRWRRIALVIELLLELAPEPVCRSPMLMISASYHIIFCPTARKITSCTFISCTFISCTFISCAFISCTFIAFDYDLRVTEHALVALLHSPPAKPDTSRVNSTGHLMC